jgi:FAD-linked sulfhydryl oxidase
MTNGTREVSKGTRQVSKGTRHARVKQGGPTSKEELGTATWVFLHTLAAQYPDTPSSRQKRDVRNLIDILTRVYPCGECAEHFQDIVRAHPPQVESREALSRWTCEVHNVVNRSLGKPVFNCDFVHGRWQGLEEGCREGDAAGTGCRLRRY